MSIKQLLKFIIQFFVDKYVNAKDSMIVKHQFIGEFIYDQLYVRKQRLSIFSTNME